MHGSTRANTHNGAREASQARRPAPARPWATAWPGWARSEPPRSTPWLPTAPAATPLPTRAAEPHGAALRERPEAAARAAGGAQRARRTPPAPVRAVAPSPAAATRARRPTTAVTADGGLRRGSSGRPRPRCRCAVAAPRRHRHLRKQGERGRVSRGRGGRWPRVPSRQLQRGATAARVANVRIKARMVAARAPRGGGNGGRRRGPRRSWRRPWRGRGCRRSSRCSSRRSRAAQRHLRGREGAVSAWPEGRQRAYLAPSSSCGGGCAPSDAPKK